MRSRLSVLALFLALLAAACSGARHQYDCTTTQPCTVDTPYSRELLLCEGDTPVAAQQQDWLDSCHNVMPAICQGEAYVCRISCAPNGAECGNTICVGPVC